MLFFKSLFLRAITTVMAFSKMDVDEDDSNYSTLYTVPIVHHNALTPSTRLRAAYSGSTASTSSNVSAIFDFSMNMPVLNLDNFPSLQSIYCGRKDRITVVFKDTVSVSNAFKIWESSSNNLSLYIGHDRPCWDGAEEVQIVRVLAMNASVSSVAFDIAKMNLLESIEEYEISIQKSEEELFIQAYGDAWFGAPPKAATPSIHKQFSFNYDEKSKSAIVQNMTILSDSIGIEHINSQIVCINCYLDGSISLGIRLRGNPVALKTPHLDVALDGNIFVNQDYHVKIKAVDSMPLLQTTLFSMGLGAFKIPGLITIGPSFKLSAGVSYSLQEPVSFSFGYGKEIMLFLLTLDMNMPLQYHIGSNYKDLESNDTLSIDSEPQNKIRSFNSHQMKSNLFNAEGGGIFTLPIQGVNGHLIPSLNIGLNLLEVKVGIQLALSNKISFEAKASHHPISWCPLETWLSHSHYFKLNGNLGPITYNKDIWASGKMELPCPFCSHCPGNSSSHH